MNDIALKWAWIIDLSKAFRISFDDILYCKQDTCAYVNLDSYFKRVQIYKDMINSLYEN